MPAPFQGIGIFFCSQVQKHYFVRSSHCRADAFMRRSSCCNTWILLAIFSCWRPWLQRWQLPYMVQSTRYGQCVLLCLCTTRLGSRCMLPSVASRIRLHVGGGWGSRGDCRAAGRSCQRENDSRGLYAPEKPYAFWHREKARQYPWPIFEGRGITKMARRGFLSGPF